MLARLARVVLPGVPHHITQRGVRSIDVFHQDGDRQFYCELVRSARDDYGITVLSYCLMKNHIHLIVIPETENSLRQGIGMIHRNYSRMINFREKNRGYLFQGRFFSCPLDNKHLLSALKYIAQNPVRAGICKEASGYYWSSTRYHLGLESENLIIKDREWFGSPGDWKKLLSSPPDEIEVLRKHFRTGRPLGNEAFLLEAERVTGRKLIPKKPGRKKRQGDQMI